MASLQIKVVGKADEEEEKIDSQNSESDEECDLDPEDFKPSKWHQIYTSIEEWAREDMEFRDEIDTPLD